MKAIDTYWHGKNFRSRLEARWAVVFEALCIDWEYEPEGFVLDDGSKYLPDFLLHGLEGRCEGDLYVEVKGRMTESDMAKIEKFAKHKPIYLVTDIPFCYANGNKEFRNWYDEMESMSDEWPFPYSFNTIDGDGYGAYLGINMRGMPELFTVNNTYEAHDWVMNPAFEAATRARFEHGFRPEDLYEYKVAKEEVMRIRSSQMRG